MTSLKSAVASMTREACQVKTFISKTQQLTLGRMIMGDNLKVILGRIFNSKRTFASLHRYTAAYKVDNSAQVFSCELKFVHV
jgi:hypothetical protein